LEPIIEFRSAPTAPDTTTVVVGADRRVLRARQALLDLEERDGQSLFGFAVRLGLTDAEAQDAVQESLLRLWARFMAGETIESPRRWTFRTLYRVAMDEHRLRRRAAGLRDRIMRLGSRSEARGPVDGGDVWAEVDRLSTRQRQVVYLRYQADLAFDEIAGVLGITASAARSHCTFALATLRNRLAIDEVTRD
jgi:RNA polymerase sigma-70 factor, ECF subfamily